MIGSWRWVFALCVVLGVVRLARAADVVAELDAQEGTVAKCAYVRTVCAAFKAAADTAAEDDRAAVEVQQTAPEVPAADAEREAVKARQHESNAVMMAQRGDVSRLLAHIAKTDLELCRQECLRSLGPLAP